MTKLEPEKHDGPIEYKLHLLLRWRRIFTYSSTAIPLWAAPPSRLDTISPNASNSSSGDTYYPRTTYQPNTQARQQRLQQLTTQLLWRLQQSSPFHSSSNAKLVLPVLPEATPRLGVPDRPSKLLPGLEESQGALYEIGVADDGTLVGLADEELEESLTNLRAMAASLGCVVDIHRRVIVGDCEWQEATDEGQPPITKSSKLWVAEVLVRPDNKTVEVVPNLVSKLSLTPKDHEGLNISTTTDEDPDREQLRIAILGASTAGKSSLLGTLTTSALDNGRGKSRLSLLKHRHEIASGITSSVAQELLGYQTGPHCSNIVVNYATGDVSSWPDIHNLSNRLVFLSDSPGLPRYSKSTFRALMSWAPAWTMICIPAGDAVQVSQHDSSTSTEQLAPTPSLSLTHLELCLKLGRSIVITVTKVDIMNRADLKAMLGRILTTIKTASKTPVLLNLEMLPRCKDDLDMFLSIDDLVVAESERLKIKLADHYECRNTSFVPIVLTSAVTGFGLPTLHALLRSLPREDADKDRVDEAGKFTLMFHVDEVFAIPPSKVYSATTTEQALTNTGVVLCGLVESGQVSLGDELNLGPFLPHNEQDETLRADFTRRSSSQQGKPTSQPISRSLSENFSRSIHLHSKHDFNDDLEPTYIKVRVVSLRNLRLSVTKMRAGNTGTIGIQIVDILPTGISLTKARKGMVLVRAPGKPLQAYRSFTAIFPASEFSSSTSPPIILGGHAIAYIHSIRAAVRVVSVALDDDSRLSNGHRKSRSSTSEDVFLFDDDDDRNDSDSEDGVSNSKGTNSASTERIDRVQDKVKVTLKFVSSVEYLELDDQVLVIPNVAITTTATNSNTNGPVMTSPIHATDAATATATSIAADTSVGPAMAMNTAIPGLSGFVGRIIEPHL